MELVGRIKAYAKRNNQTRSEAMRELIERVLKRDKQTGAHKNESVVKRKLRQLEKLDIMTERQARESSRNPAHEVTVFVEDETDDYGEPIVTVLRVKKSSSPKKSICEDWGAITCPVFAVGGWLDGYTQTIFRLVENLKAPCKGLIGPWGHKEPQRGVPGPAIGFLQECMRWWDQYLTGENRGIEHDSDLRLFLQDYEAVAKTWKAFE